MPNITRIGALKTGDKSVHVEGFIVEKSDERTVIVKSTDMAVRICNFLLSETKKPNDENSITLVLWESNIDKVRKGDKVHVDNGYVTEFRSVRQLNVGRYGIISVIS